MSTKRAIYDVAEFKALPDDGDIRGKFEALVSVFGNVDLQGDRVMEGAFADSLAEWQAKGAPIPIIWSHDWGNPNAHIGSAAPGDVVEVKGRGLKVAGSLDLDNPFAAQVYRLLKERRVSQFSFGYEVVKERKGDDGANELVKLRLIEAGPTLKGANPNTELLAVKSDLEQAAATPALWQWRCAVHGLLTVWDRKPKASDKPTECNVKFSTAHIGGDGTWHPLSREDEPCQFEDDPTLVRVKAGRSISSKNEARIRTAVESLSEVLASLGDADEKEPTPDTDEAKAQADEPKVIARELLELQALILNTK